MSARGFSLVELLVASTICAGVAAAIALLVPAARAAFEVTPAELDLQLRARTTIDHLTHTLRSSGGDAVAAAELGLLSALVPAVIPYDAAEGRFTRLKVLVPRVNGAQGVLDQHQFGALGSLSFAALGCPALAVVCGFARDATALIADGSGRFDVFTVAAADATTHRITANRALNPPYAAGSVVVEADAFTYQMQGQPDGSQSLVRMTAGGAIQPVADGVRDLAFDLYAVDEAGNLTLVPVSALTDGPWLQGGPDGAFDEDAFRIRRVGIVISVQAGRPSTSLRTFRFGAFLRNVP
jgi:prepilin-type N-terminal cleavage/methylation domain-containing protein